MTSKHGDIDGDLVHQSIPGNTLPVHTPLIKHYVRPEGTFAYLRSILWENRIKGKHLRRNLAASFLEGILASTGQGVIQGDLLLPWIHLQERTGFWGISSGCGTDTEHDFHLLKTKHGNNMDQRAGYLTTEWSSARDGIPIYGSSEPFLDTL